MGLVIVLPVLLLLRKTWFPEEKKRLRTKNTVGAAIRGLLRQSSSTKSVPVRSTSTVDCQVTVRSNTVLCESRRQHSNFGCVLREN